MGGAAGRDRGGRWAGGRRTVSAAPEARRPGPAGWRERSSALRSARCGLRRWTMSGALLLPAADRRPALTSPRVQRWARGVAPATFRRHRRLRRSARGRRESTQSRSTGRPRRDARCRCARCARFSGRHVGGQVAGQDGGQRVAGWGRVHAPRALCRGRCDGRALYGCFLCPLDTSPTPSSSTQQRKPFG